MANSKISIELVAMHQIDNPYLSCIYRIWFNSKYYIGKTKNLKQRMGIHKCDLIRYITQYHEGIQNHYYGEWIKHIVENKITSGFYEVLNVCKDEEERVLFEQMWFNSCCDDPQCLNYGFESKPFVLRPGTKERPPQVKVIRIPKERKPRKKPPVPILNNKQKLAFLRKTLKAICK